MTTQTETPEAAQKLDALVPYNEVRAQLAELKAKNAALTFDYATVKGAAAARSHIYILRKRNADIERVRKATKQEALDFGKKVDSVANERRGRHLQAVMCQVCWCQIERESAGELAAA